MSDVQQVICERRGAAGIITLNRPKALNALNRTVVAGIAQALTSWAHDPAISCVIVRGAGEKAFCAGGDIRGLYTTSLEGRREEVLAFFHEEYELNAQIAQFPKPYISLLSGIVMGGGVGISAHGSHRIAGDDYLFAMPEVAIGFIPDVGATYPLSRLPHNFGRYLVVTGDRIRRDDALYLGLATHAVPTSYFDVLEQRLSAGQSVAEVLDALAVPAGPSRLAAEAGMIERCFAADSVREIIMRVAGQAPVSPLAAHILTCFDGKSPMSMCLALEQIRRAAQLSLAEILRMDYRLAARTTELGRDFFEGVRAVLVDKDNKPVWKPPTLAGIDPAAVEAYFAPLPTEMRGV